MFLFKRIFYVSDNLEKPQEKTYPTKIKAEFCFFIAGSVSWLFIVCYFMHNVGPQKEQKWDSIIKNGIINYDISAN